MNMVGIEHAHPAKLYFDFCLLGWCGRAADAAQHSGFTSMLFATMRTGCKRGTEGGAATRLLCTKIEIVGVFSIQIVMMIVPSIKTDIAIASINLRDD